MGELNQADLNRQRRRRRRNRNRRDTQERMGRWQSRIDFANHLREKWEVRYRVKDLERHYLGRQYIREAYEDETWLNYFFATVSVQKPSLLPANIWFQVAPKAGRKPFGRLEAKIQEGVLRAIAESGDHHLNVEAGLALLQAFFRIGVLKVSYDPQFERNPRAGEPLVEQIEGTGDVPREPERVLTDEVYTWNWVDAKCMFLPDAGPNMRTWPWIAEEITLTLDEARRDTQFPAALRSQFVANSTADVSEYSTSRQQNFDMPHEREQARFRYIEAWDIDQKWRVAWAEGQPFDSFLIDEAFPPGIEDNPYSILAPIPILGPEVWPWPMPLTFNWLPIQEQYNILRRQQMNAGKRAARKWLYDQGTFPDTEEMDKFLSDVDMQGVMVNDLNRPPIMFGEGSLNPDVTRNIPFLQNDWRIVTGASGARLSDPDADTATEAVIIEQANQVRESDLRSDVTMWLAKAGSRMLQLVKQTLTLDLWVQIRGFSGADFQEFLRTPGMQSVLALQFGPENVEQVVQAIELSPPLQEAFRERFGQLKPVQVTRSELQFESDVRVIPNTSRPIEQAKMLRMVAGLPNIVATGSQTLLEDYVQSFDLVSGERIVEEIMLTIRQQQQALQAAQQRQQPGQPAAPTGTSPLSQAGGNGRLNL